MNLYYKAIWDFFDFMYQTTGLRWQVPIEFFFPHFGPWLFGKMIGIRK